MMIEYMLRLSSKIVYDTLSFFLLLYHKIIWYFFYVVFCEKK